MGVQVNGLYRNGDGSPRSVLNRQFISFSYDKKDIEEFGLVVVFDGQGLDKEAYSPFQDITTEQEELNGQLFWRSKFNANKLSFTLATDGMTVQQLERFKFHFRPGYNKELILSEHHNRAILARVASAPRIKLTPFKHEESIQLSSYPSYPVVTTLYKGEISLEFVMDEPYWYSKKSHQDNIYQPPTSDISSDTKLGVIGVQKTDGTIVLNGTINGNSALYFSIGGTVPRNQPFKVLLNNSTTISKEYSDLQLGFRLLDKTSYIEGGTLQFDKLMSFCVENSTLSSQQNFDLIGIQIRLVKPSFGEITFDNFIIKPEIYLDKDVKIFHEDGVPFKNLITSSCFLADGQYAEVGEEVVISSEGISLINNEETEKEEKKLYYCGTAPANPILSFDIAVLKDGDYKISFEKNGTDDLNEPYIRIGKDKYLRFGLPSIFTSYNYVLDAIKNYGLDSSFLEVKKAIQAVAFDYYTRAYALQILEQFNKASGKIEDSSFQINFRNDFSNFFTDDKLHCDINNQTGMVTISCTIANSVEKITEKAGNMIKSNYLVIEPSEDKYQNISSNVDISNLTINYKYMYL